MVSVAAFGLLTSRHIPATNPSMSTEPGKMPLMVDSRRRCSALMIRERSAWESHAEGLAMLEAGKTSAYFADRSILMALIASSKSPEKLRLSDTYLTIETYALALPHGDDDFRLEIDRALSHIYGSGEITQSWSTHSARTSSQDRCCRWFT